MDEGPGSNSSNQQSNSAWLESRIGILHAAATGHAAEGSKHAGEGNPQDAIQDDLTETAADIRNPDNSSSNLDS